MKCVSRVGLYSLFVVSCVCAGNNVFAKKPIVEIPVGNIVVLKAADPVPFGAKEVRTVALNSVNSYYSYSDAIETAKNMARSIDANMVKITRHLVHTANKDYNAVNATFYKADNVQAYTDKFQWSTDKKLTWNDFRGTVPANAGDNTAAATYCGIGFETNKVTEGNDPKIFVYNTFYSNQSWVRPDEKTPEILKHEQGHFDICELYTRILKQRMSQADVDTYNLKATLENIYETVNAEYQHCQQQYEEQTAHGTIDSEQERWCGKIAAELKATDNDVQDAVAYQ